MRFEVASKFLGNLPGAGGNPWVGIVYIVTLVTGAGLMKFMFFSVQKNERGVWLRLGHPVRYWFGPKPRILRPGRAGVRFPFVWRLIKVSVNVRTNCTEDIETTRRDPGYPQRQKWIIRCNVNWRVQTNGYRVMRAALRAEDLQETVMALITNALRSSLYAADVGTMETDDAVLAAVRKRCGAALSGVGVSVNSVNIIKYAPVDAQILANAISTQPEKAYTNGNVVAIADTIEKSIAS